MIVTNNWNYMTADPEHPSHLPRPATTPANRPHPPDASMCLPFLKALAGSYPFLAVAIFCAGSPSTVRAADVRSPSTTNLIAKPIHLAGLRNTFHVTARIYSGSQPDSDAAFEALTKLGVKTIVSVDGSKPDVEGAHKFGLHYVHLPFGYDGVPTNRVADLAKVIQIEPGPFYVHCHHGMHRGPTAVAVMCEADEGWTPEQAVAWLRQVGTSDDYPGLYRSAREFKPPTPAELAAATNFPELAPTSSLVDTMVAIDERSSWLKQSQQAGWKSPPGHPDMSPVHEAMMLWELFKEVPRATDLSGRTEDFRQKLDEAALAAENLHSVLAKPGAGPALDAAFSRSTQSCAACHKSYRNP
ncbi:MAG: cytochrome c [Limisphaerales bacterium]